MVLRPPALNSFWSLRHALPAPLLFMENLIIGFIAVACLAYLVFAVLRPEKF